MSHGGNKFVGKMVVGLLFFGFFVFSSGGTASGEVTITTFNDGKGSLKADGKVIGRFEAYNWFEPASQPNDNNDYSFAFVRTLLGLRLTLPNLEAYVQGQDVHMYGLPDDAVSAPPSGPLGVGGIYYAHGGQQNYHSTIIRQAYIRIPKLFVEGLSAQGGRFDYIDGLEVKYDNKKVMWLKKMRLAERLLGPFAWSSYNRSFDGGTIAYDGPLFNITGGLMKPTQGGFENDAHKRLNGIDLGTATVTLKYDAVIPHCEERLFYIYYEDDRNVAKVDNTPAGSGFNDGDIEIHNIGLHWLGTYATRCGVYDALFWGSYQFGDWGDDLDHKAWAATAEVGYQFTKTPWKPWVRGGYWMSSGDNDPTDGDHETFFQMLPTVRKYALFPFFNQMNNQDLFIQTILKPMQEMLVRADLHYLSLTEDDDRWYQGSGATRKDVFGYIGRPSGGNNTLGTLLDVTMVYNFHKHLSTMVYYGHVFGNNVIENSHTEDEDADMFFVELTFKF